MSQKKKFWGVVLIIFIYIAIAIVGFFVVYFLKNTFIKSQPTPVPKPTPIPAPSGYQTYENKEQKFSLNYPQNLTLKESPYGFGVSAVELRGEENTDPGYAPDVQILTVPKALAKTIGQDFDGYYAMADNTSKVIKSPFGEQKVAENFTKVRNREINGLRALDYTSVPSPNPDNQEPELGTMVEVGDNVLIFAAGVNDRAQLEDVLKTFHFQK